MCSRDLSAPRKSICCQTSPGLVESEVELRVLAATDGLTSALSRGAFHREAERALALAYRHRYDLSCMVFDIDHFKAVNEVNGYVAGDAVLLRTAEVCNHILRKSDIFGRIGGEEFAIVLPHTSAFPGLGVAEKLRSAIERQVIKRQGRVLQVTASFGVSSPGSLRLDASALLERADQAMHQAKPKGRNCCMLWRGEEVEPAGIARRVLKAGKIVFNNGNSVIDCTVRRLSDQGARLDVVESDGLPRRFKLNIAADAFSRACTVVEKGDRRVEIVFE
jgi:diguanylate cyclase (GGDEF)-like protein